LADFNPDAASRPRVPSRDLGSSHPESRPRVPSSHSISELSATPPVDLVGNMGIVRNGGKTEAVLARSDSSASVKEWTNDEFEDSAPPLSPQRNRARVQTQHGRHLSQPLDFSDRPLTASIFSNPSISSGSSIRASLQFDPSQTVVNGLPPHPITMRLNPQAHLRFPASQQDQNLQFFSSQLPTFSSN
jgi:hypothetical protein